MSQAIEEAEMPNRYLRTTQRLAKAESYKNWRDKVRVVLGESEALIPLKVEARTKASLS